MLDSGPWRDAIVSYERTTRDAFERLESLARAETGELFLPLALVGDGDTVGRDGGQSEVVGVEVAGQVQAAVIYRIDRCIHHDGLRPTVMRVAPYTAPRHRRRGMATALLIRCITVARNHGVHQIVFNALEVDPHTRGFALSLGAKLIFVASDCQAWIELGSLTDQPRDMAGRLLIDH